MGRARRGLGAGLYTLQPRRSRAPAAHGPPPRLGLVYFPFGRCFSRLPEADLTRLSVHSAVSDIHARGCLTSGVCRTEGMATVNDSFLLSLPPRSMPEPHCTHPRWRRVDNKTKHQARRRPDQQMPTTKSVRVPFAGRARGRARCHVYICLDQKTNVGRSLYRSGWKTKSFPSQPSDRIYNSNMK